VYSQFSNSGRALRPALATRHLSASHPAGKAASVSRLACVKGIAQWRTLVRLRSARLKTSSLTSHPGSTMCAHRSPNSGFCRSQFTLSFCRRGFFREAFCFHHPGSASEALATFSNSRNRGLDSSNAHVCSLAQQTDSPFPGLRALPTGGCRDTCGGQRFPAHEPCLRILQFILWRGFSSLLHCSPQMPGLVGFDGKYGRQHLGEP